MRGDGQAREVVTGAVTGVVATLAMSAALAVAAKAGQLREPPPARDRAHAAARPVHGGGERGRAPRAPRLRRRRRRRAPLAAARSRRRRIRRLRARHLGGRLRGLGAALRALPPAHLDDRAARPRWSSATSSTGRPGAARRPGAPPDRAALRRATARQPTPPPSSGAVRVAIRAASRRADAAEVATRTERVRAPWSPAANAAADRLPRRRIERVSLEGLPRLLADGESVARALAAASRSADFSATHGLHAPLLAGCCSAASSGGEADAALPHHRDRARVRVRSAARSSACCPTPRSSSSRPGRRCRTSG